MSREEMLNTSAGALLAIMVAETASTCRPLLLSERTSR
jgi:hypothetical protein